MGLKIYIWGKKAQNVLTCSSQSKKLLSFFIALRLVIKWYVVGNSFLLVSGYLEIGRDVFSGGQDFDISMDFRTDQLNALLLFTYNTQTEDYMLVRSRDRFKIVI